jgi:hypothetical protein
MDDSNGTLARMGRRRIKGFSIPPTVSPRILIGRPGQTREEIIAEANAIAPIDPNRPTLIVHAKDCRKVPDGRESNGEA